jgi:hypothetical protein
VVLGEVLGGVLGGVLVVEGRESEGCEDSDIFVKFVCGVCAACACAGCTCLVRAAWSWLKVFSRRRFIFFWQWCENRAGRPSVSWWFFLVISKRVRLFGPRNF